MENKLSVVFLGTGTSQGIPVIGCRCEVCRSDNSKDKRLRTSVMLKTASGNIVIDTGPDFRQQMLSNNISDIRAIILTHEHKDHIAGLDDIRPFNFKYKRPVDVYAEDRVQKALRREYEYIFSSDRYPGSPEINLHSIQTDPFNIDNTEIIPIRLMHHKLPVLGFRVGKFAYMSDVKTIPEDELKKLKGLKTLALTTLRKEPHISHMNLTESLSLIQKLKPEKAYLIHMNHQFGLHAVEEKKLPQNVYLAYDGLIIET